jgi:hypothetical protein
MKIMDRQPLLALLLALSELGLRGSLNNVVLHSSGDDLALVLSLTP